MTNHELAALRTASDARLARKRIADAKLIARVPVSYRRSPMNVEPPKMYGRPWMEQRIMLGVLFLTAAFPFVILLAMALFGGWQ